MVKEVRILMGVPSKKIKMGGPTTHLPYLVDFFKNDPHYQIRTFDYGSKIDGGSLIDSKESVGSKILNTVQVLAQFIYLVIIYRPHIIHINSAFNKMALVRDVPFALFCYVFRRKLVFKLHGSSYDLINTKNRFFLSLIKVFFSGARKVGVLSEIEKKEFIEKFGYPDKLVVVKNIVKTKETKSKEDFTYFQKDPLKVYGLFVSRIVKGKGLNDIIQALPAILETHPYFVLVVAGDGPEKDSCIHLANKLNVSGSIIWLGFVLNTELPDLISASDIYIFSSHLPEGMPMSLVEALQFGVPIITTKVRFAVNYLSEHENCLFVDAGNVSQMAEKIKQLIENKELQVTMTLANPKLVKKFSQEIVGKEFGMMYNQILDQNAGKREALSFLKIEDSNSIKVLNK
jgi:glycosyltransferase involved in cell wall biosynthesis